MTDRVCCQATCRIHTAYQAHPNTAVGPTPSAQYESAGASAIGQRARVLGLGDAITQVKDWGVRTELLAYDTAAMVGHVMRHTLGACHRPLALSGVPQPANIAISLKMNNMYT